MLVAGMAVCLGAALTACGGGGSSSQSPDPVVVDYPVAYVARPLPRDDTGALMIQADPREALTFQPGGDLYVIDRASPSASAANVTGGITGGEGDVRDISVSYDGTRLLFALRMPEIENADPDEQPTWNIWEYDLHSGSLRRVIDSDIIAEEGEDLSPHYLPDGRIVFTSTRQRATRAQLLDEGRTQYSGLVPGTNEPALQLHVMNDDGTDIRQISFGEGHDLDPAVLDSGWIVFSRWVPANGDAIHLYRIRPDGTGLELLYGANSHDTGSGDTPVQFLQPQPLQDGRVLALLRPFDGTGYGGDLVAIDAANYTDSDTPTYSNLGIGGSGQTELTAQQVSTEPGPSPGGRFAAAAPLSDGTGRLLVSWSQCRLQEPDGRIVPCTDANLAADLPEAPPLYGLWVYDPGQGTQLPVVPPREDRMVGDVAVAKNRPFPPVVSDPSLDPVLAEANLGVLHIRSVYDYDGTDTADPDLATVANPTTTPIGDRDRVTAPWFVRLVKLVPEPDDDIVDVPNDAYGPNRRLGMREIVGYAPVQPDGSVEVEVPANVLLGVEVLNADGERITARHDAWFQVAPGETRECAGCHDANSDVAHGRSDAVEAVHQGLAAGNYQFPGAVPDIFAGALDQTMAEALTEYFLRGGDGTAATNCATGLRGCEPAEPSLDVSFADPWTPATVMPQPPQFAFVYEDTPDDDGLPAEIPTPLATTSPSTCLTNWERGCRAVIHYETHIQPMWERPRTSAGGDDATCVSCHTTQGGTAAPAGQLDLTPGADFATAGQPMNSYEELFRRDNRQTLDTNGALIDEEQVLIDPDTGQPLCQTDGNGDPIIDPDTGECVPQVRNPQTGPYLSANGARASAGLRDPETGEPANLFVRMADTSDTCLAETLEPAERRLIREWLDLGAQYYNDPFAVPQN
jgi:hypothetical protein